MRVEALVAVLDTVDALDLVGAVERRRDLADDVVQPRAEAAAGDDGGDHVGHVELDHLPGARPQPLVELNVVLERGLGVHVEDVDERLVAAHKVLVARPGPKEQGAGKVFGFPQGFEEPDNHRGHRDFLDYATSSWKRGARAIGHR